MIAIEGEGDPDSEYLKSQYLNIREQLEKLR